MVDIVENLLGLETYEGILRVFEISHMSKQERIRDGWERHGLCHWRLNPFEIRCGSRPDPWRVKLVREEPALVVDGDEISSSFWALLITVRHRHESEGY